MMENALTSSNDTLVNAPRPESDMDKMFAGLGTEQFFYQHKEKEPAPVPTVNNNGGHLTMEDKQRYGF